MVTTLMHTIGSERARPVAPHAAAMPTGTWRVCASTLGQYTTNLTNGGFPQTIKRPTRPLGTRST